MIRGGPKSEQSRHKQAGAAAAAIRKRTDVAFAIGGHHGGLPDLAELQDLIKQPGGKDVAQQVWPIAIEECPELQQEMPAWQAGNDRLTFDLLVRLLFSCLVDADWSDTGDFESAAGGYLASPIRRRWVPKPSSTASAPTAVGRQNSAPTSGWPRSGKRSSTRACAAEEAMGLFAMTVPTGGGKTLAALAFALAHARRNGLRRVIYVAPYLSIIEQNAREIRKALQAEDDSELVFEHHSLAEPPGGSPDDGQSSAAARRAESWQAPVIVTTSVQFFESLFANRPGQCRKLHNIAGSVVILDECQTLPPDLIVPTCSMLGQLTRIAHCSLVLCTATQPAWQQRPDLPEGLTGVREIVPPDLRLFERLRRAQVHWPAQGEPPLDWPDVAADEW